jgi:hypothetical protein
LNADHFGDLLAFVAEQNLKQPFEKLLAGGKPWSKIPGTSPNRQQLTRAMTDSMVPTASTHEGVSAMDGAFMGLLYAYRSHGGLSRVDALPAGGRFSCQGQIRLVKDLLHDGDLFGFPWHNSFWIPLFQFDMPNLSIETKTKLVTSSLGYGLDGWALASWFVEPNPWLGSDCPIQCLESRLSDVLYAARANHTSHVVRPQK